jgi:hypothetical protein
VIEDAKLTHYLLDLTHEDGGPKARFFLMHVARQPYARAAALLP